MRILLITLGVLTQPNPFATRFWVPGVIPFYFGNGNDAELLLQKLSPQKIHQITGPHGSGKSTLTETLRRLLVQKGFNVVHAALNNENRRLPEEFITPKTGSLQFYILDGYEQLSWFERLGIRRKCWRKTGGLLLTTHRTAFGIPVLYRTMASFDFFLETVQKLTRDSAFTFEESFLRERFGQANGNFRTVFFELYDICCGETI